MRAAGICWEEFMARNVWLSVGITIACAIANDAAGAKDQSTRDSKQIAGVAAYYSEDYKGRTASGALYDPKKFTAAHLTLPFGTHLLVTDPRSHRSVTVTVNDRGPFTKGRVIDLSLAAAKALNMMDRGLIQVTASVQ